mgnify:CR=1 FL=1
MLTFKVMADHSKIHYHLDEFNNNKFFCIVYVV